MHPNGVAFLTISGLYGMFLVALLVVTLLWIRQDIRPEKDNISGMNKTMMDFVEYGHWVVAGLTGAGIALMAWGIITNRINFGGSVGGRSSRKRADGYEGASAFDTLTGIPGFNMNTTD